MAIYRGPGGAGDATNDATSQAILAAAAANQAAASATSAAASATAASTSATNAATSAANAAASEANVASNAANAATSATNAANSAATATTKASEASTSATNAAASDSAAASSATAAASSATSASNSATLAATKASEASTSATNAATSATASAASATTASTQATNASNSATAAATSATNASNSATAAATSATNAASSATTATTQATNAASSATAAATSASNAATSKTNAAASATSAASSATTATTQATNASNSATASASSASSAAASAAAAASSATDAQSSEDAAASYAASINPANFLTKANNLSDLTNTSTARTNLGVAIGTNVQAYSSELQAISNGGGNIGFKNRIINGDMRIDQRNAGANVTPTSSAYTLDRWEAGVSVASKFSVQRSTTAPAGFTNSLLATSTSAYTVGAGEIFVLTQFIEGYNVADMGFGTASASTFTISFWVRSSLTGTFGGSLQNSGRTRSYPFTYTISSANTWEQKTITVAGDTTGTWLTDNGRGINVMFALGAGSTYSGTANSWATANYYSATGATSVVGTSGATFYITGVQLEKGSTATSFDYRPYGQELALCQRYYYRNDATGNGPLFSYGAAPNATSSDHNQQLIVSMRAAPTVGFSSVNTSTPGGTTYAVSAISTATSSNNVVRIITTTTGLTAGSPYFLRASTAGYIDFSSEL